MLLYLTFAGVVGSLGHLGVSVEASFAFLTLTSFGVVQTVTDAAAPLAGFMPRRPIKMAAQSMAVAFTL